MRPNILLASLVILLMLDFSAAAGDGNRLAYLDDCCDPYYVGLDTPKLVTPQWVGEPGVEAVIVLAIDDLGGSHKTSMYVSFLQPILERLKKIDGQAPVSLMTTHLDPNESQLQTWLKEGATLEAHTWRHPCPLLHGGDLAAAKRTYDLSVDLMATIANNRPVGFRTPCCDSMSSVSPRFFAEIMGKTTPGGNFLAIDSSVFHLFTANDPELPRELVLDENGQEKFRKYVPTDRVMANLIEDYPYPYVIGRLCWELPCLVPSDWEAQHRNGVFSPITVRDMKAAVDATVIKRGVFALCFHPHGWIRNDQVLELIDHAAAKHGGKIKFMTFREVYDRLTENLLGGHPLRAADGEDNGVRVLDLDDDGYMDLVIGNEKVRQTRTWSPESGKWTTNEFPAQIVGVDAEGNRRDAGLRFGVLQGSGHASFLVLGEEAAGVRHFDGQKWPHGPADLELGNALATSAEGPSERRGVRLRDLDGDGVCELIVGNQMQQAVFQRASDRDQWRQLPFALPEGTSIVDAQGRDAGLRLVDIDEDGHLDVVFSNAQRYSLHLFTSMKEGWSRNVFAGKRGDKGEIPPIVRADGTNNGAWFKHRHMWVQNEDTGRKLPQHVFGRHFSQMLDGDH